MAGPPAKVVSGKFPTNALCIETASPEDCYLNLARATKGAVLVNETTKKSYGLCADEKFAEEAFLTAKGACTVFRLPSLSTGEELFATAGHCLKPTGAPKSDPCLLYTSDAADE